MSFLVRHSSAAAGEETTRTRREPNWRRTTGPWRREMAVGDGGEGEVEGLLEEVKVAEDWEGRKGSGREVTDLVDEVP
ncbi:hypothetical protein CDL15_Pgr014488 [Punica granatum]|uniref:Uncharacterized protein n=1 Tax=Punica granatum TaxID=22663 RepID=A0A218WDB0_PUNGR|nr:hypothetical protein CDL15_Pgr014488 [Punica granatum]PKI32545.1 hypothetical protein CRG98_047064 [Punica granatum]